MVLSSGFGFSQDCPMGVSWLVEEVATFPRQGLSTLPDKLETTQHGPSIKERAKEVAFKSSGCQNHEGAYETLMPRITPGC